METSAKPSATEAGTTWCRLSGIGLGDERQLEPEGGAFSHRTLDSGAPARMQLHQLFTDVQTQAQAPTGLTGSSYWSSIPGNPVEQFPDAALLLQWDASSVVGNTHHCLVLNHLQSHGYRLVG